LPPARDSERGHWDLVFPPQFHGVLSMLTTLSGSVSVKFCNTWRSSLRRQKVPERMRARRLGSDEVRLLRRVKNGLVESTSMDTRIDSVITPRRRSSFICSCYLLWRIWLSFASEICPVVVGVSPETGVHEVCGILEPVCMKLGVGESR
jgi:hypothetical protein